MKRLLTILAILATTTQLALAECQTTDYVKENVRTNYPNATVVEIDGQDLVDFLIGFNAIPPVTHFAADNSIILEVVNKPKVAIVLFSAGCVSGMVFLNKKDYHEILQSLGSPT